MSWSVLHNNNKNKNNRPPRSLHAPAFATHSTTMQLCSMASSAVPGAVVTLPSTPIPPGDLLVIGIDAGTGSTRTVAQHIHGIHTRETATIGEVWLKEDQDVAISQILILLEDGTVVYGNVDVNKALQQDLDGLLQLRERTIRRQKLMLHPGFKHVPDVIHASATIYAEKDPEGATQDLFEDWFRALFNDVRAYFKRDEECNAGKSDSYWDAIPLEIHISVPAMWNDKQRGIMRNSAQRAAKASGKSRKDPRISLREEALCVAIYYLGKNLSAKVGSMYTFVDVGDGTLDITTVEVIRAHSKDAPMQLRRVDLCSGNGAGAHMVNAGAWDWLLETYKQDLNKRLTQLTQLRISRHEFSRQFWKEIDKLKRDIDDSVSGDPQTARIRGSHGRVGPGFMNEWTIDLPENAINQWYDAWTIAADQLLQDHLASLSKNRPLSDISAILTGGGAKSARFVERMKSRFTQHGIKCTAKPDAMACAGGTLLQRYFLEDKLPAHANFYVTAKVHLDDIRKAAEEEQREQEQEGGGTFDPSNEGIDTSGAKSCSKRPWSEDDGDLKEDKRDIYLPHRTKIIGRYSHGVFTREEPIPMVFQIDADGKHLGRIHVDLFWSKRYLEKHTPLKDNAGDFIPGIRGFPLVFADLDDLKAKGFEIHDGDDNTNAPPYFELKAFVEMTGTSEELLLTLHVMKPDYEFPHELDGAYATVHKDDRLFEHTQEVWSKDCSHFTSNTTGTSSSSDEDPAEAVLPTREVRQRRCKR